MEAPWNRVQYWAPRRIRSLTNLISSPPSERVTDLPTQPENQTSETSTEHDKIFTKIYLEEERESDVADPSHP